MRITVLALAGVLAACATPTAYQRADGPSDAGYSSMRIEDDRYRVSFRGGRAAGEQEVRDYALLRAAELTLEQGHDWFLVTDRSAEIAPEPSGPRFSIGLGGANYGGSTGVGGGLGVSFGGGDRRGGGLVSNLEIVMGDGPAPEDVNAYEARAVAASLSAR